MIDAAGRWPVDGDETRAANRAWWDGEADDYYAEHGAFLGDSEFVWGPEGWTEAELDLLGVRDGMTVLEIGAGAAQCSRWLAHHRDVRVVASDLSMGMLRTARRIGGPASALPLVQCDGLALPLADTIVDLVRQVVAAGLVLVDLVEPEWPARNEQAWGGWSPLRGALLPGTAIVVADRL